jgi:hypothetical protein
MIMPLLVPSILVLVLLYAVPFKRTKSFFDQFLLFVCIFCPVNFVLGLFFEDSFIGVLSVILLSQICFREKKKKKNKSTKNKNKNGSLFFHMTSRKIIFTYDYENFLYHIIHFLITTFFTFLYQSLLFKKIK